MPEMRRRHPELLRENSLREQGGQAKSINAAPDDGGRCDWVHALQRQAGNRATREILERLREGRSAKDFLGTMIGAGSAVTGRQADQRTIQVCENQTGLADGLKASVERLSGVSLDDLRVHYGSAEPKKLRALAYTRGHDIFVGPGQEKHLLHELGHFVLREQGTPVAATAHEGHVPINNDPQLERRADAMAGAFASQLATPSLPALPLRLQARNLPAASAAGSEVVQRVREPGEEKSSYDDDDYNRPRLAASVVGRVEGIRNEEAQSYVSGRINALIDTVFAGSGKEPYHASHLITRHNGGLGDTRNLVPMPRSYNTGIGAKKKGRKVNAEGLPKHWGPDEERYSDFEDRVDYLVAQGAKDLVMVVQVAYGPDEQDEFLATLLDKDSLSLPTRAESLGVTETRWTYAVNALFRHLHRTLRTIPFKVSAHVAQGSSQIDFHVGSERQLLQLDRPWTISKGFVTGLAKELKSTKLMDRAAADRILAVACGHTGLRASLPRYFDRASNRLAKSGRRDYDAAVHELFMQAPPTGVVKTYDNKGTAGGVDAFIWMDPKRTAQYRFGGSQPSVSPKGFTWPILEMARPGDETCVNRKSLYVRAHLLNGLLHGPGDDPENLVPFCDAANTRMEKEFESVVKRHPALYEQFTTADESNWAADEKGQEYLATWHGIWWQSRAIGNVVRPKDYPPLAKANVTPAHPAVVLAREEAKMPQALVLRAYRAHVTRNSRAGGWSKLVCDPAAIVSHTEWNSLDGKPVLGPTNPGTGSADSASGVAPSWLRKRTFANSAKAVAQLAEKVLSAAGYGLKQVSANAIQATAKDGKSAFLLTIDERGQRMADVRVTTPESEEEKEKDEKASKKQRRDTELAGLSAAVELLNSLEKDIPAVDAGALEASAVDPAELAKARTAYATRLIATLKDGVGKAAKANPNWGAKDGPGAGIAAEIGKMESLLDITDLDGAAAETLALLDNTIELLRALRGKVAKALSGTGVKLDDDVPAELAGSASLSDESDFAFGSRPPLGSTSAGNGYWLTPGHQARLTELHLTNVAITPDGDCLFAALITMGAFAGTVREFRSFVADRVQDGRIRVAQFMLDPAATARAIRTPGSYNNDAGDSTPSIIARALGIKLLIINDSGTTTRVDASGSRTYCLIRFRTPGRHYHATRPAQVSATALVTASASHSASTSHSTSATLTMSAKTTSGSHL